MDTNDVLLRLYRRGGIDAAKVFLGGESEDQLDFPKAQQGGFAGGLFAIFVPSTDRLDRPEPKTDPQEIDASVAMQAPIELTHAQKVVFGMGSLLFRIERQAKGAVCVCRNVQDIERCLDTSALAAVLSSRRRGSYR
jgi:membrane dipeptidase